MTEPDRPVDAVDIMSLGHLLDSIVRGPGPPRPVILTIHEANSCTTTIQILTEWLNAETIQSPVLILLVSRRESRAQVGDPLSDIRMHPLTTVLRCCHSGRKLKRLYREVLGLGAAAQLNYKRKVVVFQHMPSNWSANGLKPRSLSRVPMGSSAPIPRTPETMAPTTNLAIPGPTPA